MSFAHHRVSCPSVDGAHEIPRSQPKHTRYSVTNEVNAYRIRALFPHMAEPDEQRSIDALANAARTLPSLLSKMTFEECVRMVGVQTAAKTLFQNAPLDNQWKLYKSEALSVLVPKVRDNLTFFSYKEAGGLEIGLANDTEFNSENFLALNSVEGAIDDDPAKIFGIHLRKDGFFIGIDGQVDGHWNDVDFETWGNVHCFPVETLFSIYELIGLWMPDPDPDSETDSETD